MAGGVGQGNVDEFGPEVAGAVKGVAAGRGHRTVEPFGHELARHAEAHALEVAPGKGVGVHRTRGRGGIALVMPGDDRKHDRGVLHGAGQRADLIERGAVGNDPIAGNAPIGGLESHAAAEGGGLTDGAARIRAERGVALAGRDAGRRAAAGAARDTLGIARVAGGAEGGVFRGRAHGEFVHVVLAHDDGPGRLELFDHEGVVEGREISKDF